MVKLRTPLFLAVLFVVFQTALISQIQFHENGQQTRTGSDAGMFPDSPSRLKIDLAGSWRYSLDNKEWNTVSVPSAYEGTGRVTFMRSFEITAEMLDKYTFSLVAYGINYQSEILINGNFVGRHQGGYTSTVMPIQPNTLQVGNQNSIVISVDNELTPKTTLPLRQQVGGWRTYGGITRDIYILAMPKLHIERVDLKMSVVESGSSAVLTINADVVDRWSGIKSDNGSQVGVQTEVYDKLKNELVGKSGVTTFSPEPNKSVYVKSSVQILNPKLWSPDLPDLYVVKSQLVRVTQGQVILLDEYSFDAGVRTFTWTDGRLSLNNTVTPLKGVVWMEDFPLYGSAMTYEAMEKDIAMIKSLGANLIRFQYPPHPYVINMCDRYGLLAIEDVPAVDVPGEILGQDYFQDLAANYIREMIQRDKNHTAVLCWGLGEQFETQGTSPVDYVTTTRNLVRSMDDRAVYYTSRSLNDDCIPLVDIIGLDVQGKDSKAVKEGITSIRSTYPGKTILLSRYGKNIEPENRKGYSDNRSLESQARMIMRVYETGRDEKIAGSVICSFNDWRTDRPALTTNASDAFLQSMGIVSYNREKRVAFDVVRALFNAEKVQALPVGNYSAGTPIIYVFAGLVILVTIAFYYNANRRFRDSVNRSIFRTYNFFADVRDQRILTYPQSMFLMGVVAVTWATMLSAIFSHYRYDELLDNILSQFLADGPKNLFVHLIWSPPKFILAISLLIALKIFLLVVVVMFFSLTVRTYVHFYHAFSITVWAMLPYVLLIPLAMIMYRLMETDLYVIPVFAILVIVTLWVLLRLLKGVSIIYDVYPSRVYAGGVLLLLVTAGVLYGYFDYTQSTSVYLKYLLHAAHASM